MLKTPPIVKTGRSDAGAMPATEVSFPSFTMLQTGYFMHWILFQSLIAGIADRDHAGSLATPQYHYAAGKFVITNKLHYGI